MQKYTLKLFIADFCSLGLEGNLSAKVGTLCYQILKKTKNNCQGLYKCCQILYR